jgi:hypothetical protein
MKKKLALILFVLSVLVVGVYVHFHSRPDVNQAVSPAGTKTPLPMEPTKTAYENPFLTAAIKDPKFVTDSGAYTRYIDRVATEVLKSSGHLYADAGSMRNFYRRNEMVKLPRLRLDLYIRNDLGQVKPLTTLGSAQFEWIHDEYDMDESLKKADANGFDYRIGSNFFIKHGNDLAKWAAQNDLKLYRNISAYGLKAVSIPVLPVGYTEHFPELSELWHELRTFGCFLQANEWYELRIFVFDKQWLGTESTLDPTQDRGGYCYTYFRAPKKDELETGKTIAVKHILTREAAPPFRITSKTSEAKIQKGGNPFGHTLRYSKDGSLQPVRENESDE